MPQPQPGSGSHDVRAGMSSSAGEGRGSGRARVGYFRIHARVSCGCFICAAHQGRPSEGDNLISPVKLVYNKIDCPLVSTPLHLVPRSYPLVHPLGHYSFLPDPHHQRAFLPPPPLAHSRLLRSLGLGLLVLDPLHPPLIRRSYSTASAPSSPWSGIDTYRACTAAIHLRTLGPTVTSGMRPPLTSVLIG